MQMTKSRRKTWAGHVARIREKKGAHAFRIGNPTESDHLEYLGVYRRIIFKWLCK